MSYSTERIIDIVVNKNKTKPRRNVKDPCGICSKTVKTVHKAIQCDTCDLWVHITCNGNSDKEYEYLKDDDNDWHCVVCTLKFNLYNMPFTLCDNTELININNTNSMRFLQSLPNVEVISETSKFSQLSTDINFELPSNTDCRYFSVNEYQQLKKNKNLNIFHTNLNGLESKFEDLCEFISGVTHKMDILALTETSEKDEEGFLSNVEIEGYNKFNTASKSQKGGTAIYLNNNFDSLERVDLNIKNEEFESTWVEIKNSKSKNIVTGSIYRHPHYNFEEFFKYLESCLVKLAKENKEVYLCGDFNFDLLKIDTDSNTQCFFNILCCYGFLPQILQPTRVTENSATVIDNIFSNNITNEATSGNILLTLSEHFSQFLSINRGTIDYKKINMYRRDYSKFTTESFRDDVSIQNWNYSNNVHDSFKDFYTKLEGCVDRHAPLKKLTPKDIKTINKPWVNPDILKMIKIRNKVFARKKRQPNNLNCKRLYNLLRNRVNREMNKSKKKYYAEYFAENVNNIKKHGMVSGKL